MENLESSRVSLVFSRKSFTQCEFDEEYMKCDDSRNDARNDTSCNRTTLQNFFGSLLPIIVWLPKYRLQDLLTDCIAGATVGILLIPQGMAYGVLAGIDAIHGLYTSLFPGLIYVFFGTSRHTSTGVFAILCIMISGARYRILPDTLHNDLVVGNLNYTTVAAQISNETQFTPADVGTALCFLTGVILFVLGVLRLGFLAVLLSDQVIGGFTTGGAIMVLTTQLGSIFDIPLKQYSGPGKLYFLLRDFFLALPHTNIATVVLSIICFFLLLVFQECINPRIKRKVRVPFPTELVLMIVVTGISYSCKFQERYGISIVGSVPTGIPPPSVPKFALMTQMIPDAFAISIVLFAVAASISKVFANKHKYHVQPNQELIAYGITNVAISFLHCFTAGAALARTAVNENAGAKTQISTVVASLIILLVVMVVGPLFNHLPEAVLACIIIVALKSMLLQLRELRSLWRLSFVDFLVWLITFVATCTLDLTWGLAVGVLSAIGSLLYRTRSLRMHFLGRAANTEILISEDFYSKVTALPSGVRVMRFEAPLCYVNVEHFRKELFRLLSLEIDFHNVDESTNGPQMPESRSLIPLVIILDCGAVSFVDTMAAHVLKQIIQELAKDGVKFILASCNEGILRTLRKTGVDTVLDADCLFPTVYDALTRLEDSVTPQLSPRH